MEQYRFLDRARAAVVGNSPQLAAEAVMENLNWFADEGGQQPVEVNFTFKNGTSGYEVRTRVPFGAPIYEWVDDDGLELVAFAPANAQQNPPSGGDND